MVHTELFQVKQIRRDVNFQFSLKKYDEFAAKFVDTWCQKLAIESSRLQKTFLRGRGIYINAYENC